MSKVTFVPQIVTGLMIAGTCLSVAGFMAGCQTAGNCGNNKKGCARMDNGAFYKEGKFDSAKAKQAYFALMEKFNVPVYAALKKDDGFFWAVDFAKGDFASFGMGGVIWANEK
ncbi:MAG: hypothetical protein PHN85_05805, partial [Kiritimatiellae bacterium]|nr:hypothetical protein [Kiritimatiellia bacterium]